MKRQFLPSHLFEVRDDAGDGVIVSRCEDLLAIPLLWFLEGGENKFT